MCAKDGIDTIITSVRNNVARTRKFLNSYPEVVKYIFDNHATDQAIAERELAIYCYMHPAIVTAQLHVDNLKANSCKVNHVSD